jgi:hypothetical protein
VPVLEQFIYPIVLFFRGSAGICRLQRIIAFGGFVLLAPLLHGQLAGTDDFTDGRKDLEKWDADFIKGGGEMSESGGRLEFTNPDSRGVHEAGWPWVFSTASYAEDWEFQCDVHNVVGAEPSEFASVGIYVSSLEDERDLGFIEMYSAYFDEIGESVHGFSAGLESERGSQNEADSFELPVTRGAVRVRFDRREKTLSFFYHAGDTADGYAWLRIAQYGIDGDGGEDANDSWRLNERSEFDIGIYGYAENISVRKGELSVDHFTADGSDALAFPLVQLYVEEFTSEALTIGWEAFESYTFEIQESTDFGNWKSVSGPLIGDGLYQVFKLNQIHPQSYFRVLTTSP